MTPALRNNPQLRADLLAQLTAEWMPVRTLGSRVQGTQAYNDLLDEGLIEEQVQALGKYRARTIMVRRKG